MKRIEGDKYIVRDEKGYSALCTNPSDEMSIESARNAIDKSNIRAIEKGYEPHRWVIYHMEWYRYFDNDVLEKEETILQKVEIYPKDLDHICLTTKGGRS